MTEQAPTSRLIQAAQQQTQANRFIFLRRSASAKTVERVVQSISRRIEF